MNFCFLINNLRDISVEEQKISLNYVEKIEHIDHNYKDAFMDNQPLFLDELFKNEDDLRNYVSRILSLEFSFLKENLI